VKTKAGPSDPATASAVAAGAPVKVGWLAPGSAPGAVVIDFEGNTAGPLAARSLVALDEPTIRNALLSRQPVVLLFENGDARLPIIVGLVPLDPGAVLLGTLLNSPAAAPTPAKPTEARVDGKRVVLEGEQEVVLRCGDRTQSHSRRQR
jgi:hypothetical protein